ncbi:MAG: dethiobiotin synthase, partial [Clostridiales bacterium]
MKKEIFIIGTDTNVGKTFVSALIIKALLKLEKEPAYYKPISSGYKLFKGVNLPEDYGYIKSIYNFNENIDLVCPFRFRNPVSPHLASKIEKKEIDKNIIMSNYYKLREKYDYLIVEGCGGIAVPLIETSYYVYNLIKDLKLNCFLVIKAGVGTINHTLLTVNYARKYKIKINGIIVNRYNGEFYEDDNIK